MNSREIVRKIFDEALDAVRPGNLIRDSLRLEKGVLRIEDCRFDLRNFTGVYIFGSGKASIPMARAINDILGDYIKGGFIVSNTGHEFLGRIEVFESSHPVPSEKSVKAAENLITKLTGLSPGDFFIFLLSGGSSALVEKPVPPVKVGEFRAVTELLFGSGTPIEELNVVRKHLSMVKGGRLCQSVKAAGIVLAISDVVGDDLETIGSAPLFHDRSSYWTAMTVLKKYNIWNEIPDSVRKVIKQGVTGKIEETRKELDPTVKHFIIGSNRKGLSRAKKLAGALNIHSHIMTSRLRGEAREVAKVIVSIGEEILTTGHPFEDPVCLLFGGETTVTLRGSGKGGRNQEMCLAALGEIGKQKGITFLSAATDGIDGNSNAAGAIVDSDSFEKAVDLRLDVNRYLRNNDSGRFLEKTGDLIKTGPTGTNVMDITLLLINRKSLK